MKKFIPIFLAILMLLTMIGGCKKDDSIQMVDGIETEATETEKTNDLPLDEHPDVIEDTRLDIPSMTQEEIAELYFDLLLTGDYQTAYDEIPHGTDMMTAVSADIYQQIMDGLYNQLGNFVEVIAKEMIEEQGFQIYQFHTKFELVSVTMNVVMSDNEVSGFNYIPYAGPQETSETDSYMEIAVSIGESPYELDGLVTLPKNSDNYPLVVLVQGSGPSDMDETVGVNKPFQDIAHGLAELGIASIRYDKRTYSYPEAYASNLQATVYDEVIDDVIYALEFVQSSDWLSISSLYVAGHSLGGFLIPRIDESTDLADGYIMLAGPARNIDVLIREQMTYMLEILPELTEQEQVYFDTAIAEVAKLSNLDAIADDEIVLGAYKPYYEDLMSYNALETALSMTKPLLILQGERDYQVSMVDYNMWQDTLSEMDQVTFQSFETLNHLMMPGQGSPTPDEYYIENTLSQDVIEAMATFIRTYTN